MLINMRVCLLILLFGLSWQIAHAQDMSFGSSTSMKVGSNAGIVIPGSATISGIWDNEGSTLIDQDLHSFGSIENTGQFFVKGDAALDGGSFFGNNEEATFDVFGNTSLAGSMLNLGKIFVSGEANSVLDGYLENYGEFGVNSSLQLNGAIDNYGVFSILGSLAVAGNLSNFDGSETGIDGDLSMTTPFDNSGSLYVGGSAEITDNFVNHFDAVFEGTTVFDGAVINNLNLVLGSSAIFNGDLTNNGEIIGISDAELNFVNNRNLGTLSFVDIGDRNPINEIVISSSADSIFIDVLNMSTIGTVTLPPNFVLVLTALNIDMGVLNATNQETFLVQGTINVNSAGTGAPSYVEGTMLAITSTGPTTFPMGINGSPNYFSINSNTPGITVKVQCVLPNPDSLITDENTMGLAQEVEWTIASLADSAEVTVSVDYSGIDFRNATNFINAREYDATLQKFEQGDTTFSALRTVESVNNNVGTSVPSQGTIRTSDQIWITPTKKRFALGLSPVLTEPEVYLPNVFTPGAQMSENRIFRPFIGGAVVTSVTFQVFDSFNREVYAETISGEDLDLEELGWDGTLNSGQEAPEGVYYYKVEISYTISDEVSDKYFTASERSQTQNYRKLGSVMLVK